MGLLTFSTCPFPNRFLCFGAAARVPGTEVTVKKGDLLYINVTGIHYDEKFYPNPTEFNPENFSKESKAARSPLTFLSFGQVINLLRDIPYLKGYP